MIPACARFGVAVPCRQREAARGAAEEADDPIDEFDDEETFLNLDDVLEGAFTRGSRRWRAAIDAVLASAWHVPCI